MLFKLSNLNSNLALTLGYLNPALNNLAQINDLWFTKTGICGWRLIYANYYPRYNLAGKYAFLHSK